MLIFSLLSLLLYLHGNEILNRSFLVFCVYVFPLKNIPIIDGIFMEEAKSEGQQTPFVHGNVSINSTPTLSRHLSEESKGVRRKYIRSGSKRALFSPDSECSSACASPASTLEKKRKEDDNNEDENMLMKKVKKCWKQRLEEVECVQKMMSSPPPKYTLKRSVSVPAFAHGINEHYEVQLPVIKSSKHPDLNVITPTTVCT